MAPIDELYRLVGDEDCGVGLVCRACDRGGLPVAHYKGIDGDWGYRDIDVIMVDTIADLLAAADTHRRSHHAE